MTEETINRFVSIGQELLQRDSAVYGAAVSDAVLEPITVAQPGWVGPDYRGVVLIGQNPGRGTGDATARLKRQNDAYLAWRDNGRPGYEQALKLLMADVLNWRVWNQWVRPLLSRARLSAGQVGYLNLVKVPTVDDKKPTAAMFKIDWPWTLRQLEALEPRVVVAGGVAVATELEKRRAPQPFELLTQNRVRSQNQATRDRQNQELAKHILQTLGSAWLRH
jgi:hypothetical protein